MLGFEQQLLSSIAEFRRLESESLPPGLSVAEVESYLRHKGAVNAGIMKETNALINEQLLPLLASGQDISDEVADALYKLSQDLYSLSHSLDMGLALTIHTYLLQRARTRGDVSRTVRHLYWAGMISMMFHNTLLNAEAISLLQEGASYRSNYHLIKDRETRLFINRCLGNVYVAISRLRNHS
ncbi:MAG: hypothetical protein FWF06_05815, partial [Symbiobacteriaceae bacterium]|nr:hypothetical protein [Symbiobacteriaceae bacterium]